MKIIDETEDDLKALIKADFRRKAETKEVWDIALDWIHFKTRQIPQRPRRVILSSECLKLRSTFKAISALEFELGSGRDVKPWLSESIRKRKADPKADLMFNDWQITHFHLGSVFQNPNKIKRTGELLFSYISTDHAVLLDVQNHGSWTMKSMLEILLRTNPTDIESYEVKGIVGLSKNWTDDELLKLRKAGINSPLEINGRFFLPPGMGIATSSHAVRLIRHRDMLIKMILTTKQQIKTNKLAPYLMRELTNTIGISARLGLKLISGQFVLFEKNRNLDLCIMRPLE